MEPGEMLAECHELIARLQHKPLPHELGRLAPHILYAFERQLYVLRLLDDFRVEGDPEEGVSEPAMAILTALRQMAGEKATDELKGSTDD